MPKQLFPNTKAMVARRYQGDEHFGSTKKNLMVILITIPPPPKVGQKRKASD